MVAINGIVFTMGEQSWLMRFVDSNIVERFGTPWAAATAAVGLLLLLFGIKLVRLVFTLSLAGVGGAVGRVLGANYADQLGFAQLPWVAAIAGVVVVGLLGFLLYKFWVVLAFGTVLAGVGVGVLLSLTARDDVSNLCRDYRDAPAAASPAQPGPSPAEAGFGRAGGQGASNQDQPTTSPEQSGCELARATKDLLHSHALGLSLAALAGLVVGLLIGGFAYRVAAIGLTSLCGLDLLLVGLWVLAHMHWPKALERVTDLGWKACLGALGLWLIGIAIQAAISRSGPAEEEEPAQSEAE